MKEVNIKKKDLIEKIKENKEAHIKDYKEAVIAYKKKAKDELEKAARALETGSLKIKIDLVTPVDETKQYDNLISMFEWETRDEVSLTQNEFNQYVLDEMPFAQMSRYSNSTYK